jgi:hypothetical protein
MRHSLLVMGFILCSGCVSTPYVEAGGGSQPGYWEYEFGPAKWHVGYRAHGPAASATTGALARRRASEICRGAFTEMSLEEAFAAGSEGPAMESCGVGHHPPCRDTVSQIWVQCSAP